MEEKTACRWTLEIDEVSSKRNLWILIKGWAHQCRELTNAEDWNESKIANKKIILTSK